MRSRADALEQKAHEKRSGYDGGTPGVPVLLLPDRPQADSLLRLERKLGIPDEIGSLLYLFPSPSKYLFRPLGRPRLAIQRLSE